MTVIRPTILNRKIYAHISEGDQLCLIAHYPDGSISGIRFYPGELDFILGKLKEGESVVLDPFEKTEKEQIYLWRLMAEGRLNDMKFTVGKLFITRNARQSLDPADVTEAFLRYIAGDWGDLGEEDRRLNNEALEKFEEKGDRLLGVYHDRNGTKFWIITEADRSMTTILLPEEY